MNKLMNIKSPYLIVIRHRDTETRKAKWVKEWRCGGGKKSGGEGIIASKGEGEKVKERENLRGGGGGGTGRRGGGGGIPRSYTQFVYNIKPSVWSPLKKIK